MDREIGEGISGVKEKIYKRTSISSTRLRQKNKNGSRCMLQTQDLKVGQANESYIGLTQENLIENSIQDCLPYILNYHGLCYYFFSLS